VIVNVNPQRGELTLAIPGQETADENRNFTFDIVMPPTVTQDDSYN